MSENTQAPMQLPPPCEMYQPADTDTVIIVKFVGNTPQIQEMRFVASTAEHLMVAGERLKIEYHKLQALAEEKARAQGILTTTELPSTSRV